MISLEQVIETAGRLPPEDRRRLQQWLTEQERRDARAQMPAAQPPSAETPQQQMERFRTEQLQREVAEYRSAKQWIAAHRAEYLGQWVALEGDRLICHGPDALQVDTVARAAGIAAPFVVRIVEEPKFRLVAMTHQLRFSTAYNYDAHKNGDRTSAQTRFRWRGNKARCQS